MGVPGAVQAQGAARRHARRRQIAALDPESSSAIVRGKPALHRFPGSMGKRAHAVCQHLVDHYGGKAEACGTACDGAELFARLKALPGFGDEKSMIFIALLAKRMGVQPQGWEEAAGPFGDAEPRSVADIDSTESFARVREWKKAKKKAGKTKQD